MERGRESRFSVSMHDREGGVKDLAWLTLQKMPYAWWCQSPFLLISEVIRLLRSGLSAVNVADNA